MLLLLRRFGLQGHALRMGETIFSTLGQALAIFLRVDFMRRELNARSGFKIFVSTAHARTLFFQHGAQIQLNKELPAVGLLAYFQPPQLLACIYRHSILSLCSNVEAVTSPCVCRRPMHLQAKWSAVGSSCLQEAKRNQTTLIEVQRKLLARLAKDVTAQCPRHGAESAKRIGSPLPESN